MKPTLVVLAAGLGSRYGGLKQVDTFGPSGETLLDYTVFDAIRVGFGKIVFVIRETMAMEFIPRMTSHFGDSIELEFVSQKITDLPTGFVKPKEREKPWGTAHAIWSTRKVVSTTFCIVNADDFYGRAALHEMHELLIGINNNQINGCLVGYTLKDTLSSHGAVSRGVCNLDNENLISITEFKEIEQRGDLIIGKIEGGETELPGNTVVSMNLMGFSSAIFPLIETEFIHFLQKHIHELKTEFYAPELLQTVIEKGIKIPVSVTNSVWFGVTYPEDKPIVKSNVKKLTELGEYPHSLWN